MGSLPDESGTEREWAQAQATFRRLWGHAEFRPPQGEVVRCLLARRDALVVLPTGGGKSVCFQLPALLGAGLTLVVSPLVALMENQVRELREKRLPAAALHGELSRERRRRVLAGMRELRLLYLSPETLLSPPVWQRLCHRQVMVAGVMLDEAHCLVQWGETFRPAYRRLGAARAALEQTQSEPIAFAAFTATADPSAQKTIREVLGLRAPEVFLSSPYRAHLSLRVERVWAVQDRRQKLWNFVRNQSGAGLVYVRSRRGCEELARRFGERGVPTAAYHAGLGPEDRREIEAQWLGDRLSFVVCTSAFGLGINKPNCRWVVHFQPPQLLAEYLQEIGRAGRDGRASAALLLASEPTGLLDPEDKQRRQFFADRWRDRYRDAIQLARKLPPEGDVEAIAQQLPRGQRRCRSCTPATSSNGSIRSATGE